MPVVSDASPLILFAKIGRLDLLKRLIDNMVFVNFWYENTSLIFMLMGVPTGHGKVLSKEIKTKGVCNKNEYRERI